jgi:hypothetical protein
MYTIKLNEQYIQYVQSEIAEGRMPVTKEQFTKDLAKQQNRKYKITRWSEKMKASIGFFIDAPGEYEAGLIANRLVIEFENKHTLQNSPDGKVLTEAEQIAKAEKKIASLEASIERRIAAAQRRVEKMEKTLAKLMA